MITTIEEAQHEVAVATEEACAENPEVGEDDVAHDMVISIALMCPRDVAFELCRREFGAVPSQVRGYFG